jgi:hypothetical protein
MYCFSALVLRLLFNKSSTLKLHKIQEEKKMKSLTILLTAACLSMISSQSFADSTPVTQDRVVALSDVFVPGGFDSNSDAYVVVSGIFPNGCYKWKGASKKDVGAFEHEITSTASVSQGMCIQVLVPFTKDIRLGRLPSGSHTLRFLSNDGTYIEKNLVVE